MASAARVPFLEQQYYHIALPRNVPGREDGNLHHVEEALLKRMLDAVARLSPHVAADVAPHVQGLRKTLLACQILNVDGTIGKAALMKELRDFSHGKMLVLHIAPQNCALLVYPHDTSGERNIIFEAFETSATADKVLAAKGALQWDFPGCAVSVPASTINEEAFQEAVATFIEQASSESVTKFAAITWKAAATIPEIRDTSDPALISGLLMTILEANGAAVAVPRLRKRVRDTVTFDNARTPWRRSAFYLVLRVAAQRYLYHHLGAEVGSLHYKTLMCLLHAQLLEDVLKKIPLDAAYSLRQKLGRRLAKLNSDVHGAERSAFNRHSNLLLSLSGSFESALATTGGYLKQVWRSHSKLRERRIPKLRQHAHPEEVQLRLTNSGRFLRGVLVEHAYSQRPQQRTAPELLQLFERSVASVRPYMRALESHIASSKLLKNVVLPAKQSTQPQGLRALRLSNVIREYVTNINAVDQVYPNQKSQQLLHLMELWVLMDKDAVNCYPLLEEYHPGFDPDLLDPIQLLTREEMIRSQKVRMYLKARFRARSSPQSRTIFAEPADDCFAAQYYDREDHQGELCAMREEIETKADSAYDAKHTEWEEKSQRHAQTIDNRNEKECVWDAFVAWDGMPESRHRLPCEWHNLNREAKGIRIQIYEHPLPSYEPAAKAALFELQCPEVFAAYRDATWLILSTLCREPTEKLDRMSLIREYTQLLPYVNKTSCQVTLGSHKKAHLECHYANWGFPIGLEEVIRTCGLKPRYFDCLGGAWTDMSGKASFWHHFPVKLPLNSPLMSLDLNYFLWPTSNEIQANQARCPQGVGVHEFTALQGLLVGTHSRWLDLLRELGSTNLNFSSESTWSLVLRLVLQLGSDRVAESEYTESHRSLLDDSICSKLFQQVCYRLEAIRRNWREPVQMEILITILLKVTSLSPSTSVRNEGRTILHEARKITDGWRRELQPMVTEDPNVLQPAIWASLLCKQTMHVDDWLATPEGLRMYLDASISLRYNLAGRFDTMPFNMRNAIAQDTLFAYEHREAMKEVIMRNADTFRAALDAVWHVPGEYDITEPGLAVVPDTWYLSYTLQSTAEQHSYFVHYDYVYGTLLIDGQEMGTLPQSYRMDETFRHVLGVKNPIVYPSPLRGMDFALSESIRGHRVHLGYRNKRLIIRADHNGELLEFIPSHVFGVEGPTPDLPRPLVEACYHWLHVYSGHVEIRQNSPWVLRHGNWWIRWHPSGFYHAVRRFQDPSQTTLLDAGSALVKTITRIFTHFEFPSQILVFASTNGRITVELKRMELSFHINQEGLLHSLRLGAVILQNQDAGTWYGLMNKIVVQSVANRRQKSILIPWGGIRVSKDGHHVFVDIEMGQGVYLKYAINDVLGRIDCAPEPRLLYMKALLHAYTSHAIADPLTRRTGKEEALYLLQTGAYQPWNPLLHDEISTLKCIAKLSPKRGYYPPDARCMETVLWRPECTVHMQDDRYDNAVAKILQTSSDLSRFYLDRNIQETEKRDQEIVHLAARAVARSFDCKTKKDGNWDTTYSARDARKASRDRLNVLEVSKLLLNWKSTCSLDTTLIALLHDAPVVGGYDKYYRKCLLTDHLAVDIKTEWGALAQRSLQCTIDDRFGLMFLLGTIAFSSGADLNLLRILISFAMIPEIRAIPVPPHAAYFHFRMDGAPPVSYLISLMEKARMPFAETGFKKRSQLVKAESLHGPGVDQACELLASSIVEQWPTSDIDAELLVAIDPTYLDIERALADVALEWTRLTRNHELALYLEQVQEALFRVTADRTELGVDVEVTPYTELLSSALYSARSRAHDDLSLSDLLKAPIVNIEAPGEVRSVAVGSYAGALAVRSGNIAHHPVKIHNFMDTLQGKKVAIPPRVPNAQPREIGALRSIVANFKDPTSFVQCRYAKEMDASIDALQKQISHVQHSAHGTHAQITTENIISVRDSATAVIERLRNSLYHHDPQAKWLEMADTWPRLTTVELLTELRIGSGTTFGSGTKEALVAFGVAVSRLQRLLRIQDAQKRGKNQQGRDEWANEGHSNWNPKDYPDWLLLEIDGDILIREEQVQVALATISPQSNENSVLQLLMGKGKTSCILPMVASLLADRTDLARVVVPRALLLQSAQVMQAKLGGLVNRELMHIPFSRKTPPTKELMSSYGKIHARLKYRRGVLIALPEHVLSFKLSGLQQLCDENLETASMMIDTQRWLDRHTRDVLDECDVSLAIRTQLIYPSGTQTTVDGHPMRWQVIQACLHLVKDFASNVQSRYPRSIEVVNRGSSGFPLIYFLRKDAEDYLIELLVRIICKGQTPSILPCAEYPAALVKDVQAYISKPTVRSQAVSRITSFFRDKPTLMRAVNLLRGMFVHRILITTLRKRWNVQYGLHPTRAPIAVPYLAKGVPSPTAEWGHPDVAITLTCLSFYYQGLTGSQFKEAFAHLVKTDEPSIQYEKWFPKGVDIPKELDDYAAINAEDMRQLSDLYQVVRFSASLMDFYLNNFVFPKYAKTFSLKLQASGWNLFPSFQGTTGARITGFSGTNDSRHQLPLLVQQQDLPQLAHTNAEVPYYLLAPRNQSYIRMIFGNGARWTEKDLLENLANRHTHVMKNGTYQTHHLPNNLSNFNQDGRIRILIDAGAQVLEHSNKDFAKAWLDADHDAAAAVYFDDDHRVWALYRTGRCVPLVASPFVDDLDRCVVYLDESHCRGTDIKFPPHARAALTLGQHLTKDTLVQAAMRLRLLGQTQSITFFSPVEVHQGILDRLPKGTSEFHQPNSGDVLRWVFGQTCDTMEQLEPSYFAQTLHYLQQEQARLEHPEYLHDDSSREAYLTTVRIKEALSLKQLYEPKGERHRRAGPNTAIIAWKPSLQSIYSKLVTRKKHFQDRGSAVHASALEEVEIEQERETEREIEVEVENVREVQQAILFNPHKTRRLHGDIRHFAEFGRLVPGSDAYQPMFSVLGRMTSLGLKHTVHSSMKSGSWISAEFSRTVEVYAPNDNYIRSSHWVLWSTISQQALLVSPEEANQLIPIMQEQQVLQDSVSVHLIIYAAPVTRRMLHFNQLDYYAIPALPADFKAPVWLRVEMGIFAGRLYLEWDEYYLLLEYLGVDENLSQHPEKDAFAKKPLTFVHEWLALRRKGQDFEHTPMGFVTTGKPLTENHPFFRKLARGDDPALRQHVARAVPGQLDAQDEEDHDDHDDEEEFVPAVEHVDDSEGEDEGFESSSEEAFVDAEEGE